MMGTFNGAMSCILMWQIKASVRNNPIKENIKFKFNKHKDYLLLQ